MTDIVLLTLYSMNEKPNVNHFQVDLNRGTSGLILLVNGAFIGFCS